MRVKFDDDYETVERPYLISSNAYDLSLAGIIGS